MTVPFSNDIYPAVSPGGAVFLQVTFETWYGSGDLQPVTGVQLVITPAAGGTPLVSTSDLTTADNATFTYQWQPDDTTAGGDYTVTWTGVSEATSDTLTLVQTVVVVPLPQQTPSPGLYATVAQYQAWSGDTFTSAAALTVWVRRATEIIDNALIAAVYQVDADGMPVDAATRDGFMRATCAQVEFMIANNDRANVKFQYQSTAMGGVSLSRAPSALAGPLPKLAPQAASILHVIGVLPSAALSGW